MSFPSEPDMMSKELQNSDLIYVNLMTDVFKIIVKYRRKIIAKYRHLSPSGNQALGKGVLKICSKFTGGHPCSSAISIKLQSNKVAHFQNTFS